jgi:hypothetical protein
MKRIALVICLAAILLLALAVPAFADGTSGTVYGKAVLAPYAITITGADAGNPLTYQGTLGHFAQEQYDARVVIQNTGTQDVRIKADVNGLPTDGVSTWNLGADGPGNPDNTVDWVFGVENAGSYSHLFWVLPPNSPYYGQLSESPDTLAAGDSLTLGSLFGFPNSTSSMGDHYMSATFSAVDPGDSNEPLIPPNQ